MSIRYKEPFGDEEDAVIVIHLELGCLISCIELQKYSTILLYAENDVAQVTRAHIYFCLL